MSANTLRPPPPVDVTKSEIENVLELTQLTLISPNLYTNTRPLWHPPGARGIYGGAVIAQCLAVAQLTVPKSFLVHSMHCYFILAGNSELPIIYHVERVRDGRSFATRTVQARQNDRAIFTTTMSFNQLEEGEEKEEPEGKRQQKFVQHAVQMQRRFIGKTPDMGTRAGEENSSGNIGSAGQPGTHREKTQDQKSRMAFWSNSQADAARGLQPFETRFISLSSVSSSTGSSGRGRLDPITQSGHRLRAEGKAGAGDDGNKEPFSPSFSSSSFFPPSSSSPNPPVQPPSALVLSPFLLPPLQPQDKKARMWIRARGRISPAGGPQAHLSALAYMSDAQFLYAIARIHGIFVFKPSKQRRLKPTIDEDQLQRDLQAAESEAAKDENGSSLTGTTADVLLDKRDQTQTHAPTHSHTQIPAGHQTDRLTTQLAPIRQAQKTPSKPTIGMMVSLDHTIYFHDPTGFRADEWIYSETHSPWAGRGRGLVIQHMYAADGRLIATCVQEGVVRLNQDDGDGTAIGTNERTRTSKI